MTIDLTTLHLAEGGHEDRDQGVCLLEAVAWFAGKEHTDHPPCVSPALGAYGRALNDVLPDEARQSLIPFIPAMPGTAGDGKDVTRGLIALDWLVRTYLPAWCDLVPALADDAAALRGLLRITDLVTARSAGKIVRIVRDDAAAAWDAAGDAAWAAAADAAGDAARAAAWAAAGDAAGAAAGAAAGDAAGAALAPTVAQLQKSAIALLPVLIAGEWPDGVQ